ncbi:MAG: hypothetical protein KW788_01025 [Candidatus Doudnabacteria bacterium]|nr:hypothetical protein [Candidatus Doudnabacteria bacterium]
MDETDKKSDDPPIRQCSKVRDGNQLAYRTEEINSPGSIQEKPPRKKYVGDYWMDAPPLGS